MKKTIYSLFFSPWVPHHIRAWIRFRHISHFSFNLNIIHSFVQSGCYCPNSNLPINVKTAIMGAVFLFDSYVDWECCYCSAFKLESVVRRTGVEVHWVHSQFPTDSWIPWQSDLIYLWLCTVSYAYIHEIFQDFRPLGLELRPSWLNIWVGSDLDILSLVMFSCCVVCLISSLRECNQ